MGDVSVWAYALGTPAWLAFLVYVVRTVRDWPNFMARYNERQRDKEAAKEGDWKRLRDEVGRLSERVKHLEDRCHKYEQELIECHRERDEERGGRLEAEALLMGRQRTDQALQLRLSAERQIDANKRKGEE